MADIADIADGHSEFLVLLIANGDDVAVRELRNHLWRSIKDTDSWMAGPRTMGVLSNLLATLSSDKGMARKATGKKTGDPCALLELLSNEVKIKPFTPLATHLLFEILEELRIHPELISKAFGRRKGRSIDRVKKTGDVNLAMLVVYYHDVVGEPLNLNSKQNGAYYSAAAHVFNKSGEPTEAQIRRARFAWGKHKEEARRKWKEHSKSFGGSMKPKPDFVLRASP